MYIKLVIFYSVVIYSQGVLSGVNFDNISNKQNNYRRILIANTHDSRNPLNLTSTTKIMSRPSFYQKQQQNKMDSARVQLPLNQHLKQQSIMYRRNNLMPNEQSIENKNRDSFNQNIPQFRQELNNFTIKKIINREDPNRNEKVLEKTFDARHLVRNTDIRSDNLNRQENNLSENQPVLITVYKNKQSGKLIPIPKQSNVVTNSSTEIENNLLRINREEGLKSRGNDPSLQVILNQNKNRNHPELKNRYVFVRKNGNIEYYDSLESILKKYPHVNIANNVPRLVPNPIKPKHDTSLPQKIIKPAVNNTVLNNITKETVIQYTETPNQVVPFQKILKVNNIPNYVLQNNSEQSSNLQETEKKIKNSQMLTNPLLKTIYNQEIKDKRPLVDENQKILKISQNTQHKSNITETLNLASFTDIPIAKKSSTVNVTNFIEISNITEKVQTKANEIDNVEQAPATLITLNNHVSLSNAKNVNDQLEINTDDLKRKTENITSLQEQSNLNDSQIVDKPVPEVANTFVKENSLNISKQSTVTEKITAKEEKNNSSFKNQSANDDQLQTEQANTTKNVKVTTVMNTPNDISFAHTTDDSENEDYEEDNSTVSKPVLWIRTTDPEFWSKLVDNNDDYSFVYIINVQSQSKIEREKNKTIFANGTVVEELTETTWENSDDKPKVNKTVKIYNAVNS